MEASDPIPRASPTKNDNYIPKNTVLTPGRNTDSVSDAIDAVSGGEDEEAASGVESANMESISSHISEICIVCHLRPPFKPKRDGESYQICRHCQSTGDLVSNLIYVRRSCAIQFILL